MKQRQISHIITIVAFTLFIALGLACGSTPESTQTKIVYTEIPFLEFRQGYRNGVYSSGQGIIIEAYIIRKEHGFGFGFGSSPSDTDVLFIPDHIYPSHFSSRYYDEYISSHRITNYSLEYLYFLKDKKYKIYICIYDVDHDGKKLAFVDFIEGLLEDHNNYIAHVRAEREREYAQQEAERELARQHEQTRLANLYRQAGNNYGNLRNTSRRYGYTFGNDYITTIINFGDGNFIRQSQSALGMPLNPRTGTYRVNGDTVIFLSSNGEYSYGTIIGTALNIDGNVYR